MTGSCCRIAASILAELQERRERRSRVGEDQTESYIDLVRDIREVAARRAFAPEAHPETFHPDATESYKQTQFDVANVQLTFHGRDTSVLTNRFGVSRKCVKVEPDIDYYKESRQAPMVARRCRVRRLVESGLECADSMAAPFSCSNLACCERVVSVLRQDDPPYCVLANRAKVQLPHFFAAHVTAGDEIAFPIPEDQAKGAEIYVSKRGTSTTEGSLYLAPIGYVTQPKTDKYNRLFVSAEVQHGGLGISAVYLPCHLLREYFYRLPQSDGKTKYPTFYELLGVLPSASPAEMRVAFKLRRLELKSAGSRPSDIVAVERAFNILAQPELRVCYDALLLDPEAPAVFPYGGFGSLLVSGERSRDGASFFARRILASRPDSRQRRFHPPLRKCDFYQDHALCRDVVRRLEFWIDPAVVPLVWDTGWNRWKHLLGLKMEAEGTFVESGRYRKRQGEWELVRWETGLPSRLRVRLSADATEQIARAHNTYQRFGQYSRALDQVRLLLDHRAVEKTELERICAGLKIPADFDIAQISWRPDYDAFFYQQLSRRARRVYLFRSEYIFDLEKAVVIETPQLGHATYVFAKPRNMERFLHLYTRVSKEDIRRNKENVGERLGFLKRVIHGSNPRPWLKELRKYLGEKLDSASAGSE